MRNNGEIERDAQIVKALRRIASATEGMAGTLAAICAKLTPPVYITPKEAIDAVTANPKMTEAKCLLKLKGVDNANRD